jgi:hypothetical protein
MNKTVHPVSPASLQEMLSYSKETGRLTWSRNVAGRARAGQETGTTNYNGYLSLIIKGRPYRAHRVAWAIVTGSWPIGEIDHIDGVKTNNEWSNLRDVTRSVNQQNKRRSQSRTPGHLLGTSLDKRSGRWRAQIKVEGKYMHLGLHESAEAAHAAYILAKRRFHDVR